MKYKNNLLHRGIQEKIINSLNLINLLTKKLNETPAAKTWINESLETLNKIYSKERLLLMFGGSWDSRCDEFYEKARRGAGEYLEFCN